MTGLSDANASSPASGEPIRREDLVAYLDGELEADAARRLEDRLSGDESLREELRRLERAWDMLAMLPRTEANPSLTKSTVEMLALESEAQFHRQADRRVQRRRIMWGVAAAMLFTASLLGTILAGAIWPDPDAPLLRDLPVVQQSERYREADNIEFLRLLRERGFFVNDDERQRTNTP